MEAREILKASVLDITFDGRNKEYGAYELRKNYNKRLVASICVMVAATMVIVAAYLLLTASGRNEKREAMVVADVQLEQVAEEKKIAPPPPPPPQAPPQKIETAKFTPPKIVKDNEVKQEDRPPEQEKLQDTKIGTINQEGVKDLGVVGPQGSPGGTGVVEAPKPSDGEDYDKTFIKVEIESEFPGGAAAWLRYLNKNFRYPEDAITNEIQGMVLVQFIVDKDGNVSNVEAISGPDQGGLREEAVRVIEKSGKWIPAQQNGRKVKSYKRQPVIFKLQMS